MLSSAFESMKAEPTAQGRGAAMCLQPSDRGRLPV
jgi:hypothetical protein